MALKRIQSHINTENTGNALNAIGGDKIVNDHRGGAYKGKI